MGNWPSDPTALSRVALLSKLPPLRTTEDRVLDSSSRLLSSLVSTGMAPSCFKADFSEISGTPRNAASQGMSSGFLLVTHGRFSLQRGQLVT